MAGQRTKDGGQRVAGQRTKDGGQRVAGQRTKDRGRRLREPFALCRLSVVLNPLSFVLCLLSCHFIKLPVAGDVNVC